MISLPKEYNYIAAFLNFSCQLRCSYCINHHGGDLVKKRQMMGSDWIEGLERVFSSPSYGPNSPPVTLQGGEPTIYPDFYQIASHKPFRGKLDLLTNLVLNENTFMNLVPPDMFKRGAPYASIRVSWHVGQNDTEELLYRVAKMQKEGYEIGVWAVDHPDLHEKILKDQHIAQDMGIDFRLKQFLGPHKGEIHGTFRYPNAVDSAELRFCECRTNELLIAPDGAIYRCHSDLYGARLPIGHLLSEKNPLIGQWMPCAVYGKCNSCDIKVKNDRYQKWGYSSVEIRNITESYASNTVVEEVTNTYGKPDQTQK